MTLSGLPIVWLLGWGTLAGLDLVSVLQGLLARPLVIGPIAGAVLGDVDAGLKIGASVGIGLALAIGLGTTIPAVRRLNARAIGGYADRIAAGDPVAVRAAHLTCLGHDIVRSLVVATIALVAGAALARLRPGLQLGRQLTMAAMIGATWAVAHGAVASARSGPRWRWAVVGLAVGFGATLL
jgi:mannose/fructose/N-acetylgalactosamine-specific phosphotransferase system component IIC